MESFELSTRAVDADGVRVLALENAGACEGVTGIFSGHVIGVHLGKAARVRQKREDESFEGLYRHGQLTTIPADCQATCWTQAETSFVHVHLGRRFLTKALEAPAQEVAIRFRYEDPVSRELVLSMLDEARERGDAARLYLESAAVVLWQRLVRAPAPAPRRGLPGATLRRVLDYLHEHLAETPGVQELSAIAGMSAPHFARSFRAATGEAPHRYLNRLRLKRAKQLLAQSELRIVEVALAVGFANPSHFSAFFRAATGSTPATYRRRTLT